MKDYEFIEQMAKQCFFANNHDRLMRLSELRKTVARLESELHSANAEYSAIINELKRPREPRANKRPLPANA